MDRSYIGQARQYRPPMRNTVMNGLARILWFQRRRLTKTQLRIAELLRQGRSQSEAAEALKITRQAISKQVLAMGWLPYAEAEEAWRVLLDRYISPMIEKRNVSHQR